MKPCGLNLIPGTRSVSTECGMHWNAFEVNEILLI